jgi:hypothetical protein
MYQSFQYWASDGILFRLVLLRQAFSIQTSRYVYDTKGAKINFWSPNVSETHERKDANCLVGVKEALRYRLVVLVEGGPDLLTALDLWPNRGNDSGTNWQLWPQ